MKYQGFLHELFQISAVKWLCEPKSFICFQLTFPVLPGYLNYSVTDVTTNVTDVTLCESLLSIEDKSAILHCSGSRHGNNKCWKELLHWSFWVGRIWKSSGKEHLKDLLKGKGDLLRQDAVFFPCNDILSEHWFLGVMFPQEMCIVVLDSLPGKFI